MDGLLYLSCLCVQVVRYSRGGSPLWISSQHIPSEQDVPPCVCGAQRTFEFQVVTAFLKVQCPQLIFNIIAPEVSQV